MVTLSPKAGQWPRRTAAWSPRPPTNSSTRRDLPTPAEPRTLTRWQVPSAAARSNSRSSSSCSRPRPDHGRDRPPGPARAVGQDLQQPPDVLRLGGALDRHRPGRLGLDGVGHQPVGLLAEQDLPGAGRLLEPLGQVDGGAGELLLQGAGVADEHVAGVDAEPDVELEAALAAHLLGQLVEGGAELGGRPHGPQGVVLVQLGDAEGGHEAVAVALADAGPALAEGPADGLAVAVQEPLHGLGLELAFQLGRLDHVAEDDRDDPELLGREPGADRLAALQGRTWPAHPGRCRSSGMSPCQEYMDDRAGGTVLLVTVPASGSIVRNSGTRNGAGWLGCGLAGTRARSGAVAPERKRSARDYEQALRRQELAAGRALVQALGAEGSPGARELAAAKRVLTQALFDLRRLGRDLDQEIEGLRAKGPARPGPPRGRGRGSWTGSRRVRERRRGGGRALGGPPRPARRRARPPPAAPAASPGARAGAAGSSRQGGQPRGARDRGEVSGRTGAAPARPERPRSHRSRRSPG